MRTTPPARISPRHQHGAALLIILAIIGLGAAFMLVSALNKANLQSERDKATAAALAQAKEALIGWSLSRNDGPTNPRPGELPCPDTNAPGTANYGTQAGSCTAGAIGRLPWRTLGIEEPKDGYGETLWYAIAGSFRKRPANDNPINSDTRASLLVYAPDGITLATPAGYEAAAIIFSPGPALGAQARGTAAEQTAAANYLDSAAPPDIAIARNNANINGPFVQGNIRDANGNLLVNDHLLFITARELISAVEKRVASELKILLNNYYLANGNRYPHPAAYNDPNCLDVGSAGYFTACPSDPSQCRGRVPEAALSSVPGWFSYNLWGQVIYYGVGTNYLASAPPNCSPTLTVNGTAGTRGLFIMPGTPLAAIVRNSPSQSTTLSNYLEDAANQDGWTALPPAADQYCTPGSINCLPAPANTANDRLYTLP
ncbi:MAG: hypothetical protein ACM3JK_07155 [Betaproteobacteria bacterium]